MTYRALVLLSGGQDSTICLAQACADFPNQVMALGFDYGQRHRIELEQAQMIAQQAGVPFECLSLPFLKTLSSNALTSPNLPIKSTLNAPPSTFVPGRNLFFLSIAAVYATERQISTLYTGVCQTDYSGYPDCRQPFIASTAQTISLALETPMTIKTPLMFLTKAQSILHMQALGKLSWLGLSHTCYNGQRPPCQTCPACILRAKGFAEAGIEDPLLSAPTT